MREIIVVFANSVKNSKHCVAGKNYQTKKWVRPVADASGAELSDTQCTYKNPYGTFLIKPLQKVEIDFLERAPLINQPENYTVNNTQWVQNYKIDTQEMLSYLDSPETLWGVGNRVDYSQILSGQQVILQSLYLVEVQNLELQNVGGKRRARFLFQGVHYDLPVTDPNFDKILGSPCHGRCVLCVSLAGNYGGYCYKIVATIFRGI